MNEKIETKQVAVGKELMRNVNIYCATKDIRTKAFIAEAIKKALTSGGHKFIE
jgi:hypothetical protein